MFLSFLLLLGISAQNYILPLGSLKNILKKRGEICFIENKKVKKVLEKTDWVCLFNFKDCLEIKKNFFSNTFLLPSQCFSKIIKQFKPKFVLYTIDMEFLISQQEKKNNKTTFLLISRNEYKKLNEVANLGFKKMIEENNESFLFQITLKKRSTVVEVCLMISLTISISFLFYFCCAFLFGLSEYEEVKNLIADKKLAQALPTKKYKEKERWTDCAICLCCFEKNDLLRILPCEHFFHLHCIDPWLQKRFRWCPICRREAYDLPIKTGFVGTIKEQARKFYVAFSIALENGF